MGEQMNMREQVHPISLKVSSLASLFSILAFFFAYPSKEQIESLSPEQLIDECKKLILASNSSFQGTFTKLKKDMLQNDRRGNSFFRAEYTRLFITPPTQISLKGSSWVKTRTQLSRAKGEAYAVSQIYRDIGLRNKAGTKDPYDHLVSELDYMSYVANAEVMAWNGGDAGSAYEWRKLGDVFMRQHFAELALGVSSQIECLSNNALMRLCGLMLGAVVAAEFYELGPSEREKEELEWNASFVM